MKKKKPAPQLKINSAYEAKLHNIVDMALIFSAMMRLLQEGSKQQLKQTILNVLPEIFEVQTKEQFDKVHDVFCDWGVKNIRLAEKRKNGQIFKESAPASYGQIGKTFNVILSVVVYYSHLPNYDKSLAITKWLHAAVDTKMMKHLKKLYPDHIYHWPSTIEQVGRNEYFAIQEAVKKLIDKDHNGNITPTQYEDIYWEALNR